MNRKVNITLIDNNQKITFECNSNYENEYFKVKLTNQNNNFKVNIIPKKKIELYDVNYEFDYLFSSNDQLLLNGFQSWTHTREVDIDYKDNTLKYCPSFIVKKYHLKEYSDLIFENINHSRKYLRGFTYAYIRRNNIFYLMGSINEKNGYTVFYFDTKNNKIKVQKDCLGIITDKNYEALNVIFLEGNEEDVFDSYFNLMGIKKQPFEQYRGYTSWYNYYQNINEKILLNDLNGLDTLPVKPNIFQIDDGYQTYVGDWLDINKEKFPNGLKIIVEKIKEKGYTPGLWLAPFIVEKESNVFKRHPDWILKDDSGKMMCCGCNWSNFYALDIYNEEVREYIKKSLQHYIEMGFEVFKLDFLYAVGIIPRLNKSRGQIMYESMVFLRDILKDKKILGCGVPLASAFSLVDYCRIGPDISLDFDNKLYMRLVNSERPSTKWSMHNAIFRRQLNTRAFINDTDVFILRDENTKLTLEQKKDLARINCLCGGIIFASDNFASYSQNIKDFYSQVVKLKPNNFINVESDLNNYIVYYKNNKKIKTIIIPK